MPRAARADGVLIQICSLGASGRDTREQSPQADLGLDSLSMIDVACAAEDAFGIRVSDEDLERFVTVGDAADHIERAKLTG